MIGLVILQVALIALNAIFAGTEIAFVSVNEARLGQLEEEGIHPASWRPFKLPLHYRVF